MSQAYEDAMARVRDSPLARALAEHGAGGGTAGAVNTVRSTARPTPDSRNALFRQTADNEPNTKGERDER